MKREAFGGWLLRESLRGAFALAFAALVGYLCYLALTAMVEHI
ncbi:MAG: hypothetical protein ACRDH9_11900 [Actinomycetota bacterium]